MKQQTVNIKIPCYTKENYLFMFHYVEDYPSLKDCIVAVEKSLFEVEKEECGVVVMVFTDLDKMRLMPTYHTKYFINKEEINESQALVSNDPVEEVHTVEHKVNYTQGVANKMRLMLRYEESIHNREVFEAGFRSVEWKL